MRKFALKGTAWNKQFHPLRKLRHNVNFKQVLYRREGLSPPDTLTYRLMFSTIGFQFRTWSSVWINRSSDINRRSGTFIIMLICIFGVEKHQNYLFIPSIILWLLLANFATGVHRLFSSFRSVSSCNVWFPSSVRKKHRKCASKDMTSWGRVQRKVQFSYSEVRQQGSWRSLLWSHVASMVSAAASADRVIFPRLFTAVKKPSRTVFIVKDPQVTLTDWLIRKYK